MRPTRRTVLLMTAGVVLAVLPTVADARLWVVWLAWFGTMLLAAALDVLLLVRPGQLALEEDGPRSIYMGETGTWSVRLTLRPPARSAIVELLCDLDPDLEPQPAQSVGVGGEHAGRAAFLLRPRRRGVLTVDALWLRWTGPLGLMELVRVRAIGRRIEVVPDIGAVRAAALRFFSSPTAATGLKTERYAGEGSEFESLRKYVPGLDPRSIDWKASARHRKLLSRRFRAERNHQVILALDTGHLMSEPVSGVPRVDHAINRGLVLGYVCLRTGDRVGLYGFDAEPGCYVEPAGGVRAMARLRHTCAEIDYGAAETNFTLGMLALSSRLRRRSLIVVFTEFVDTVTAELMVENLDRLARRHVILFVTLRDPSLDAIELAAPTRLADVGRAVVASELRLEREVVFERLRRSGVHVIDAAPDQLTVHLLNKYMDVKRRELV